jgi:hypothetical protein
MNPTEALHYRRIEASADLARANEIVASYNAGVAYWQRKDHLLQPVYRLRPRLSWRTRARPTQGVSMISEEEFRAHLAMMDDFLRRSKEVEIEQLTAWIEADQDPGWRALLQERLDAIRP